MPLAVYTTIEFDLLAFEPDEVEKLRAACSEFGATRVRPAFQERGGTWTTLWLVLTFIGLEYAGGIIGSIGEAHARRLQEHLKKALKRGEGSPMTQNISVKLSFDDFDLVVNLPQDAPDGYLVRVAALVSEHLSHEPLRSASPRIVAFPVRWGEDRWEELSEWKYASDFERYWGIGQHGCPVVSDTYDSHERRILVFGERPPDSPAA